jgi:hypothetical protein
MIDVHELLRMKEDEIIRVRKEIDALYVVAQILSDSHEGEGTPVNGGSEPLPISVESYSAQANLPQDELAPESADAQSESIPPKRSLLRNWFGHAAGE